MLLGYNLYIGIIIFPHKYTTQYCIVIKHTHTSNYGYTLNIAKRIISKIFKNIWCNKKKISILPVHASCRLRLLIDIQILGMSQYEKS